MKLKEYIKLIWVINLFVLFVCSCETNILERPPLTTVVDDNFWRNETDVRLYANSFYENYFIGYNVTNSDSYAPYTSSQISDDLTRNGLQTNFENIVPASRSSVATGAGASWLLHHAGPTWNFYWVRKANIFLDRIEKIAKPNLTQEEFEHWIAVGRFFRAFEYCRLVSVFGDVPYFDRVVKDNEPDMMYKDRDSRAFVMDQVYEDFLYVLDHIRTDDGKQFLNKNIAAAFISRLMLFEGTFLHYHNLDAVRAKKYLELTVTAADIVKNSGQYSFSNDYKSLFASENLDGNQEVLLWRAYDAEQQIMHSVLANQNGSHGQGTCANLDFVKSFPCIDGQNWENSSTANASSFDIQDLVKSRDSRFEATFLDLPHIGSRSLFYIYKHAPRDIASYIGKAVPLQYTILFNTTDAPVIRFAEVVLNWIEAKAVLAEFFGESVVTQTDLDESINAIRERPIAPEALAKGVQKTAPLKLSNLPNDPERDLDVSPLIWEIRRERRIEFFMEQTRLLDLKRWKKMKYMDFDAKHDYYVGAWINIPLQLPEILTTSNINVLQVQKHDGNIVTYNGNNANEMVGFYVIQDARNRQPFGDEVYMAPVGERQIIEYMELGYKLTQTVNW